VRLSDPCRQSNTACFQIFLNVISRKFARQDILLVLDGAPNHRCKELALPNNISLLFLPPYSPELNPKEISGMKSVRNSSRTTPSNPSTPCAPNSNRRSSISNVIPKLVHQSRHSHISSSHPDVEMVSDTSRRCAHLTDIIPLANSCVAALAATIVLYGPNKPSFWKNFNGSGET